MTGIAWQGTVPAVSGQVVDRDTGVPLVTAVVEIRPVARASDHFLPSGSATAAMTDHAGRFMFADVAAGVFSLRASAFGYLASDETSDYASDVHKITVRQGQKLVGLSVPLQRPAAAVGVVRDESDRPVADVEVLALRAKEIAGTLYVARRGSSSTRTDDRGEYHFSRLIPGDYVLAVPSFYQTLPRVFSHRRPTSSGLSKSGERAAESTFALLGDQWVVSLAHGPVGPPLKLEGGGFSYATTFVPSLPRVARGDTLSLRSGEERTVDLHLNLSPEFRVSGALVGPRGPLAATEIQVTPEGLTGLVKDGLATVATGTTDGNGRFMIAGVPVGRHALTVRTPGLSDMEPALWARRVVDVVDGNLSDVDLMAKPMLMIRGRLEAHGTSPSQRKEAVAHQRITLESMSGEPTVLTNADGEGTFVLRPSPGRYTLTVGSGGWHIRSIELGSRDVVDEPLQLQDDAEMTVTLSNDLTQVSGRVTDGTGAPARAQVVLFPRNRLLWAGYAASPWRLRSTRTGSQGEYLFAALPPGDYLIAVVPAAMGATWGALDNLDRLSATATGVALREGDHYIQNLHLNSR